jgi:hypothetical protein
MGLFGFGKKKPVVEKDPMDCTNRETEWYFSDEGKTCWEEAKSHAKEMVDYVNSNGLSSDTLTRYLEREYMSLPLFPMKFIYEYIKASNPNPWDLSNYHDAYILLALFLSGEGCDDEPKLGKKIGIVYPSFLDWDKNPLLRYYHNDTYKMFFSKNAMGFQQLIDPSDLITIIRYIDSVAGEKDEDANEEGWIKDQSSFIKKNIYTHEIEPFPHAEVLAKIKGGAKYPELIQ